jgi:hypothetical protein
MLQIKEGNNLIAGLRATNEIPPIQLHGDDKFKEIMNAEKADEVIEMKVCTVSQ